MYIAPHLSVARLPGRSSQPRFTMRPLASSLVVHGALAAALLLFAHRAIIPVAPEIPPVPMFFLPLSPPPSPPAQPQQPEPATAAREVLAPTPAPPSPRQEPEPVTPPDAVEPSLPLQQPVPVPETAPVRPPPAPREARPLRPRPEPLRHAIPHARSVPLRREPQTTAAEPAAVEPPAIVPASPVIVESGPVIPPRPLSEAAGNRQPYYPDRAKRDGEQGRVILRVDVSAEGRAAMVAILRSSGFSDLDQSAAEAVRGWRFIPATRGGRAIPGVADVPVAFTLADQ